MGNGYSRSPKLVKGALVELSEPFLGPVPNIIVFQYNPEKMTRTLTPWSPGAGSGGAESGEQGGCNEESTAQPFDPGESFSLTLELDATDALEEPGKHPVAVKHGVADRIAALEMLLYPMSETLLGKDFGSLGGTVNIKKITRGSVPIVLFVWGRDRMLPVRLTSFSVEEQAYSPKLHPIRAKVTVGLQVLAAKCFNKKELSTSEKLAKKAYDKSRKKKEKLARANLANSVESVIGMIPF